MKSYLRTWVVWGLTGILTVWLAYFAVNQWDKFTILFSLSPYQVAVLFLVGVMSSLIGGLTRKLTASRLGVKLSFLDWYGVTMFGNLLSLVLPARGELLFSAYYLRQKCGLSLTRFGSIAYGSTIVVLGVLCLQSIFGLGHMWYTRDIWFPEIFGIVMATTVVIFGLAYLPLGFVKGESLLSKTIRLFLEGWQIIRSDRRVMAKLIALSFTGSMIFAVNTYLSYRYLGFEIDMGAIMLASAIIKISLLATITPGNLGIKEAVTGFASYIIGVGFAEGVVVSVLQRVIAILVYMLIGGIFGVILFFCASRENQVSTQKKQV